MMAQQKKQSKDLEKLFVEQLKDIYSAETQLVSALPKMAKAASTPELQQAFNMHLDETRNQVQRLEQLFEGLNATPRGKKCKGMEGLIEEGNELIQEKAEYDSETLDAGLIAAAQKVEHYEISAYGTVRAFAEQLGRQDAVKILNQTLDEEYGADRKLSAIAEGMVNQQAAR
jgi:ferritin-like metal-binding protein YciE